MNTETLNWRTTPVREDMEKVEEMVRATRFFREDEVKVAVDLVQERLVVGKASGYEFIFAELGGRTVAYSCYGLIPCSLHSYDLYWIVTHPGFMNRGIGKQLLERTEEEARNAGGHGIYAETSSRAQYLPTQKFYEKNRYILKARFEDFYEPGDDKLVYVKYL